jgi:hypothetical protein
MGCLVSVDSARDTLRKKNRRQDAGATGVQAQCFLLFYIARKVLFVKGGSQGFCTEK